jgi:WD domain, G-beta repeat
MTICNAALAQPVSPQRTVDSSRAGQQVTVTVRGGSVIATTSDPAIELTVADRGQLLKIADAKTGQEIAIDTHEFAVPQGAGENSLRVSGDVLTFHRGAEPIVEIRRTRPETPPSPSPQPAARVLSNAPVTPPRFLGSGKVSDDGRHVVTSHFDRTIRIWDAATGQELRTVAPYHERIRDVAFPAEGREIVIVSDHELRFLDAASGRAIRTLEGGNIATTHHAAISADGRRMLTAAAGAAHVGNVPASHIDRGLPLHMDVVNSVAISANGRRGLSVGGYVTNCDIRSRSSFVR